jgi:ribonuclease P protein component
MAVTPPGKTERLATTCEYKRVYTKAPPLKGKSIWVYRLKTDTNNSRIGISISRSILKKATARNRLKRVIREWFKKNMAGGYDIVVVLKRPTETTRAGSRLVREELSTLLLK